MSSLGGISVAEDSLERPGYLLRVSPTHEEIVVRSLDPIVRQRFTIGHELGHWLLERLDGDGDASQSERWCDDFAVGLLMPARWVMSDLSNTEAVERLRALAGLHERYSVSRQAMRLRVADLLTIRLVELIRRETEERTSVRIVRRYGRMPKWQRGYTNVLRQLANEVVLNKSSAVDFSFGGFRCIGIAERRLGARQDWLAMIEMPSEAAV